MAGFPWRRVGRVIIEVLAWAFFALILYAALLGFQLQDGSPLP